MKKILGLAPHPDDLEFGCGGSLARFHQEGHQIWYVAFSPCDKSLPKGFNQGQLYKELKDSARILGIPEERIITLDFKVRTFPEQRQEILEWLYTFNSEQNPDLVLVPNSQDIHQDHATIHQEAIRAFKRTSILGYELPWNNLTSSQNHFVCLDEAHLNKKWDAIKAYKTQSHRTYLNESFIRSLAISRGVQIGEKFAESFEVIRWIH